MSQIKTVLFASTLSLFCVLISGCAANTGGVGNFVVDNNRLKEIQMENARFELLPSAMSLPLHPSVDFWLKQGDQVAVKWSSLEFHWERIGAMCAYNDNTSTNDCNICDYCRNPTVQNGPPCFGTELGRTVSRFDLVVMHEGFILNPGPKLALSVPSSQMPNGCPNSSTSIAFQPEKSATYQIIIPKHDLSLPDASPFDVVAETKIHVVEPGIPETAAYQLTRETVDGTNYWFLAVLGEDPWRENFSPNLRVTGIRIRKGKCEPDLASGKACSSSGEVVKPSRLLFLPDFSGTVSGHLQEGINRCYSIPSLTMSDASYINLDRCRNTNSTDPQLPTTPRIVTPTYDPDNSSTPDNSLRKLTWLVEFNTGEGADSNLMTLSVNDPMPQDAELVIEFTIEAI